MLSRGGPGGGCRPREHCLPHPVRLDSLHMPFLISDCVSAAEAPGTRGLGPGLPTAPRASPHWLSSWSPQLSAWQREEQSWSSSRRGRGKVNTGQMLESLFRDPVYWSKSFHLENIKHAVPGAPELPVVCRPPAQGRDELWLGMDHSLVNARVCVCNLLHAGGPQKAQSLPLQG